MRPCGLRDEQAVCKPFAGIPIFCLLQHLLATVGAEKLLQTGYAKQLHLLKDSVQVSLYF